MHYIELKIYQFLNSVYKDGYKVPQELLDKFTQSSIDAIKRQFEREPSKFHLSMGNIGRPICQLQFEAAGVKGEPNHNLLRNLYGHICEDLVMFLLRASGITIISEQERVSLDLDGNVINGVLDVILEIDGEQSVWDIKSASGWAFQNKFKGGYEKVIQDDTFGYGTQLALYASSKSVKIGGWIAIDKSSGEISAITYPKEQSEIIRSAKQDCLSKFALFSERNNNQPKKLEENLRRQFSCLPERVWGKETGNTILNPKCTLCNYKWHCWKGLKLEPARNTRAKDPKLVYYVDGE